MSLVQLGKCQLSVTRTSPFGKTASTLIPPSINLSAFAQNSRVSKTKTVLYVRPCDGLSLGAVSSSLTLSSGTGRDQWLGWSWDGTTASYIVNEGQKTVLYVRPFDGPNLGAVSSSLTLSSGTGRDQWVGWEWNGKTASYVVNE